MPSDTAFDRDAYDRLYAEFSKIAKEELDRHLKDNEAAIQAANREMWAAWGPQFDALAAKQQAARERRDYKAVESIQAQIDALNAKFAPVQAALQKAIGETRNKIALDRQMLQQEYELAVLEASERGLKLGTNMREAYQRINANLAEANAEFEAGMQTLRGMINQLNHPGLWRSSEYMGGIIGGGYSGPARQIREGSYEFIGAPGHLVGALAAAEEQERKLKDDLQRLNEIDSFERKLYASTVRSLPMPIVILNLSLPKDSGGAETAIFSSDQGEHGEQILQCSAAW